MNTHREGNAVMRCNGPRPCPYNLRSLITDPDPTTICADLLPFPTPYPMQRDLPMPVMVPMPPQARPVDLSLLPPPPPMRLMDPVPSSAMDRHTPPIPLLNVENERLILTVPVAYAERQAHSVFPSMGSMGSCASSATTVW